MSSIKRFELPALDLNFGSITDGTNIPPPPDSPVQREPTPPATPHKVAGKDIDVNRSANASPSLLSSVTKSNGNLAGTKRTAEEAPLSPASSTRQGSLRRLFSRNMLNNSYAEGQLSSNGTGNGAATTASIATVSRPASQSGGSVMDERKSKRSSGWFRRLRTGDTASKRSSVIIDDSQVPGSPRQPVGPPPPMIPELSDLEKDDGSLGSDLFKNIK
ncbi:hypothetical protein B0I35DRAFT_409717 [Stachybotrys elegans]|uniref:Uncharacterized protein n=1 Tax=Stachybotrys elegans TaxID=80388 RepID=A0A8K0SPP5_9HYPO|nr:hypothetical protein B0I35DRAFT_409717 [Stachybotrys elegans]